jgi:acyl-CoA synthetase (AMP-forming)/AMP-acid ligase II
VARPIQVVVATPDGQGLLGAAPDSPAGAPPDASATALLMYTSGTTGVPKGVMLTHASLAANAEAIGIEHGLGPADRVLAVLPLYHINAFVVTMLAPLAHGGSLAVATRFSAAQFWRQAVECGCTWLNVVPTIISYLIEADAPPRASLTRIRFCRSASAALPSEQHRAFEATFGIGIVETMGLTETAAPAFSNPLDPARRKLGSVGRASGGEARVVDAALEPVADGTTGEIVIRGPHVMRGYYKNPDATAGQLHPRRMAAHRRSRPPRRRRLLLRHGPHQGADHQGRREHRPARDRRRPDRPPRRPRGRCRRHPRTGTTARRSWPASSCVPAAPARKTSCATSAWSGSAATRYRR